MKTITNVPKSQTTKKTALSVAIGPIPHVSGTRIHILNIVKHSRHNFNLVEYSPLSFYSPLYRGSGFLLRHKVPFIDPYGYYLAKKVLPTHDIVHTHGHPYWWDLYKKSKRSKAKYIHTVHQIYYKEDYDDKMWSWLNNLNERLFQYCKQADVVISVSKWLQDELREQCIDSVHIPNGVDVGECEKANAQLFREKYNINNEDFFLFVGHTGRLKRVDLFIELAKKMPDKLFVICGPGTTDISVPRNVVALGHLSHNDVLDAIAACRVFIMPSSKESFGFVLVEAMACKKPVVATNNTGMKETVWDNKDGYLFELDDINELHEKACRAWDNPKIGISGYQKIKQKYDLKVVVKQIDELYEGIARLGA